MTSPVPPDGLAAALRSEGFALAGPLGAGSGGPRWAAGHSDGTRWAVTVLTPRSAAHAAALRHRLSRLAAVGHAHLPRIGLTLDLPGDRFAVLVDEVPGTDLTTVCAGRGRWEPGEVVTILVPLLDALATLHAADLVHGDVAPGNVILTPEGRAVLVDLVGGADSHEAGTPDVAAPERAVAAGAPGDVHAAARLGLLLLDDRAAGAGPVLRCLESGTAADPAARPTATELGAALYQACDPMPVALPDPGVLARIALRRLAEDGERERALRTRRVAPAPPRPRRGRHRRGRQGGGLVLSAVIGLVLLVCGATVAATTHRDAPAASTGTAGAPGGKGLPAAPGDPVAAAVRLTWDRAHALVGGDAAALAELTVPGSPAAAADRVAARRMEQSSASLGDLDMTVTSVARVPAPAVATRCGADGPAQAGCGTCVEVHLVARLVADTGPMSPTTDTPADGIATSSARPVVLVMHRTRTGWRVSEVRESSRRPTAPLPAGPGGCG